ncbi:sigma-70 family RNA polymerase sigma factor [Niabella sp. CC-SYL272]|uniref:RNA polymerase sigma factor n=1 Tax=Niabella agricola TaxID=2891571 RepID=UPI001F1D58F3|nr:sigma-70 family RNA polymerase sigma factor [Niabella agricola]MCF3110238.1 sigma-70 family RNA polymerase sigma factor [Niabella agricola]
MPKSSAHERKLLTKLAAGSRDAFTEIYLQYSPAVYDALLYFLKEEHDADELLQVIFIKVWEKRQQLAQAEHLENYLFMMTRNSVLNHLKQKAREETFISQYARRALPVPDAEGGLQQKQYLELLKKAIDALPLQQQRVYTLAEDEELSYEEIARRLSISKLTVKKHLELARRQVRAYMRRYLYPLVVLLMLCQ